MSTDETRQGSEQAAGKTDASDDDGTFYASQDEVDEAATDVYRKQGPGANSAGTGAGGPGARSHKSSGG